MSKKIFLLAILLLFACMFIVVLIRQNNNPGSNGSEISISPVPKIKTEGEEKKELTLNFKSTQIVISGYPYANKDDFNYPYRLFNIVYTNYVKSELEFEEKYLNSSDDNSGIYIAAMDKDTIYLAMSKSIWHKMEIVNISELEDILSGCSASVVELAEGYEVKSYACSNEMNSCYMPIDSDQGLLYLVYGNLIEPENFCDIAKANSISGVSLKSY